MITTGLLCMANQGAQTEFTQLLRIRVFPENRIVHRKGI